MRLCNAAIGVFGSNPKGTGALGRHSVLPSSPRSLVLASSCALIGAPGHPFAYAPIALAGPNATGSERTVRRRRVSGGVVFDRHAGHGAAGRRWTAARLPGARH